MYTKKEVIIVFLVFAFSTIPFATMAYETYLRNNCKIEALKSNKSTEDIILLCR